MSQTNYFWQNNNVSPESYANRLEGRRLELLDFFHGSAKDYNQELIDEWLCLTRERDRIFRETHFSLIKRDLNQSVLLAYESIRKCLQLSFTLQNTEFSDDLWLSMVGCMRKIAGYIKENKIEPIQIVLCKNYDNDAMFPRLSEIKRDAVTDCPITDFSFVKKVEEWKISPESETGNNLGGLSPVETQSNATFESCFDSILVSSVSRKTKLGLVNHRSFLTGDPTCPIDLNTKYVDKIKEIMNTSFD